MDLVQQLAQLLGPVGVQLLVQQGLGALQIGHPQKRVLFLLISHARLV